MLLCKGSLDRLSREMVEIQDRRAWGAVLGPQPRPRSSVNAWLSEPFRTAGWALFWLGVRMRLARRRREAHWLNWRNFSGVPSPLEKLSEWFMGGLERSLYRMKPR